MHIDGGYYECGEEGIRSVEEESVLGGWRRRVSGV